MFKRIRKLGALSLTIPMLLLGGCSSSKPVNQTVTEETTASTNEKENKQEVTAKPENGEVVPIRFGTHYAPEIDPRYRDPITDEAVLNPEQIRAGEVALQTVLDELNVDFQFVQYAGNTTEVLLQSVMAGDPVCEIAWMWNGSQSTVLAQNVLQPLDEYEYIFDDDDSRYMLYDEVYGNRYFISHNMINMPTWPLVYNIDYIEAVDALKEDGKTVYPTDLYLKGEWTWSKFEEYLAKIDAYYTNSQSPNRPERRIEAFQTDFRFTALHAIYANGGGVYGQEGLMVDTEETKEAVEYIGNLLSKNLATAERWNDESPEPGWTWSSGNFANGETVFTNIAGWMINEASVKAAERGESIAIVPFPRPDSQSVGDAKYQQAMQAGDCAGVLKGVSPEKTKLALEAYKLYFNTYYKELAGSDKALDYITNNIENDAVAYGFDIFHPEVGEDILTVYKEMAETLKICDSAELTGVSGNFNTLLGNSYYGLNGVPKYDVAIASNKAVFDEKIHSMQQILASGEIRDNIAPQINNVEGAVLAFPAGTDLGTINWGDYVKAEDNIDGPLDITTAEFDITAIDSNAVGTCDEGLVAKIKDSSGNETTKKFRVIVYDGNNTSEPQVVVKEEYRKIKVDEDAATIAWANDFIETAQDKDGIDIKGNIVADLSQLDTTTAGTYEVELTVTDYVGNVVAVVIEVVIE
ncbi:MAG: hypothetical protein ACRC1P_07290 [Cellulosilyticaceae bacterium]